MNYRQKRAVQTMVDLMSDDQVSEAYIKLLLQENEILKNKLSALRKLLDNGRGE